MYNVVEFFSGIGSQAEALDNMGLKGDTLGTCEWDVHAIIAYDLIHNSPEIPEEIRAMDKEMLLQALEKYTFSNSGKEALDFLSLKTYSLLTLQRLYLSITRNRNFVDINALSGDRMPENIDILTYSFPCQDLSNVGAFHGYNKGIDMDSGSRSSLLWQVGRILEEIKTSGKPLPRFLLMENVPTLLSDRHFPNFSIWINDLKKLGYESKYFQLNAALFGLPQNRPRLLMISVQVGDNREATELVLDYFRSKKDEDVVDDYRQSPYFHQLTVQELLRTDYTDSQIFEEACECTPNDTVSRRKIWDENPQIVKEGYVFNQHIDMIRTITTKQDRNPNSGNLYFESGIPGRGTFRYLTPRECMLFMGFTDSDYQRLKDNNLEFHKGDAIFARDKVIRMSGNSIPVKLLEGMFYQIWQIDRLLEDYKRLMGDEAYRVILHEERLKKIRSFLFNAGIRSRNTDRDYPEGMDIIYPKYNTAIIVKDCNEHGHNCEGKEIPVANRALWEERFRSAMNRDDAICKRAVEAGWNVVALWSCAIDKPGKLLELQRTIMENGKRAVNMEEVTVIG